MVSHLEVFTLPHTYWADSGWICSDLLGIWLDLLGIESWWEPSQIWMWLRLIPTIFQPYSNHIPTRFQPVWSDPIRIRAVSFTYYCIEKLMGNNNYWQQQELNPQPLMTNTSTKDCCATEAFVAWAICAISHTYGGCAWQMWQPATHTSSSHHHVASSPHCHNAQQQWPQQCLPLIRGDFFNFHLHLNY